MLDQIGGLADHPVQIDIGEFSRRSAGEIEQ